MADNIMEYRKINISYPLNISRDDVEYLLNNYEVHSPRFFLEWKEKENQREHLADDALRLIQEDVFRFLVDKFGVASGMAAASTWYEMRMLLLDRMGIRPSFE